MENEGERERMLIENKEGKKNLVFTIDIYVCIYIMLHLPFKASIYCKKKRISSSHTHVHL